MNVFKMKRTYIWMFIGLLVFSTLALAASAVKLFDTDGVPRGVAIDSVGAQDVNVQDQHSPTIILPMAQELAATTLFSDAVIGSYTIELTSATGAVIGQHLRIINSDADRYYFGTMIGLVGTTATLDTQIDFDYVSGSEITLSNINMAVDGSGAPVIFTLRTGEPSIPSSVDITRVIFTCVAVGLVDLTTFGDLAALTRGVVFRRTGPDATRNLFNIKTNADLANMAYDFEVYAAANPVQGKDGFVSRLTFAGQNKMGVVLRIEQYDNLEMLIQDDIDGLTLLNVILEGHVVVD